MWDGGEVFSRSSGWRNCPLLYKHTIVESKLEGQDCRVAYPKSSTRDDLRSYGTKTCQRPRDELHLDSSPPGCWKSAMALSKVGRLKE